MSNVSFGRIIRSLFPGGSITGAPKKVPTRILEKLEAKPRGALYRFNFFFRGKADCSINIRTAEIDLATNKLEYGAGGGITLLSN